MVEAVVTLLVVLAGAVLTGAAIEALVGRTEPTGLEPAIGLAALFLAGGPIAQVLGIRPAVLAGFLGLAAIAVLGLRKGGFRLVPGPAGLWVAAGVTVLLLLIPFATNGFWGLLGVGYNNDLGLHLAWAESIRSDFGTAPSTGYPLGPHALAATISLLPGFGLGEVFVGMIMATGVVAVMTGYAALSRLSGGLRLFGAVLVGLAYLMASYYAQAAFKEMASAAFVLAFVMALPVALDRAAGGHRGAKVREAIVPVVLLAGLVAVYSFPGLTIPIVFTLLWLVLGRGREGPIAHRGWIWAGAGAVVVVLVLAFLGPFGFGSIFSEVSGSDTYGPVSPVEALGTWLSPDYRLKSTIDTPVPGLMALLGIVSLLAALVWWARRGRSPLTLGLGAAVLVYLFSLPWMGDYSLAKILVLASPLAMAVILTGLFSRPAPTDGWLAAGRTGLAWVFVVVASASSLLVLRDAPVGPTERTDEIAPIAERAYGGRVLFATQDRFAGYKLPGSKVFIPLAEFPDSLVTQSQKKPFRGVLGESAVDFDSFTNRTLGRFDYVVTTSAFWNSQAPRFYREVLRTPSWVLWERTGRSRPRGTLFEGTMAAKLADCSTPGARFYSGLDGYAVLMPETVVGLREDWSPESVLRPGRSGSVELRLGRGDWKLSLQYFTPDRLTITGPGLRRELEPTLDSLRLANQESGAFGPFWDAGEVSIGKAGSYRFTIDTPEPTLLQRLTGYDRRAVLGRLVATRDEPRERVPLSGICGKWVDYYVLERKPPAR